MYGFTHTVARVVCQEKSFYFTPYPHSGSGGLSNEGISLMRATGKKIGASSSTLVYSESPTKNLPPPGSRSNQHVLYNPLRVT